MEFINDKEVFDDSINDGNRYDSYSLWQLQLKSAIPIGKLVQKPLSFKHKFVI